MQLDQCINFLLNRAQQTVTQLFKERLLAFDLTPMQYAVLNCLWQETPLSPKQLAELVSIERSAITGVLDRLEGKGLTRRVPDAVDRRSIQVHITEQALALEVPVLQTIEQANQHVLHIFMAAEARSLQAYLLRLSKPQG